MVGIHVKKNHTFLGHTDSIYTLEQMDSKYFFSSGGDGMVVLWNTEILDEGDVIARVKGSVYALLFNSETNLLYVAENADGIHAIDVENRNEVASVHLGDAQIFDLKLYDNKIWVGLSTGELIILTLDLEVIKKIKISEERIRSIEFSGKEVAIGLSDHTIKVLDYFTLKSKHELRGHKNSVFSVKYHPSGKYLISGGRDAHLKVWDTNEGYVLRESIPAHLYTINHLTFINNGRYFVTCSMDKAIKLWDAYNFKLLKVLDKHRHASHGNSVNKLLWMESHDLLVSCSDDRSISVWDLKVNE